MIQNPILNSKIETRSKEVLAALGRPDPGLSVKQISFEVAEPPGGQLSLTDLDGTWEITFSDGGTCALPLKLGEKYDADSERSEKLKAAIMRCLT